MLSIFPAHDSFQLLSTNNQIIGAIMLDTDYSSLKGDVGSVYHPLVKGPLRFLSLLISSSLPPPGSALRCAQNVAPWRLPLFKLNPGTRNLSSRLEERSIHKGCQIMLKAQYISL